ncbi:hypothetical protein MRB53_041804 [Persea americana]|nr:hypothetical protein MRB53_041804 [Persea americana]
MTSTGARGSPLEVVALISGGKDSLFSVLHCQAAGHKVVALANLYPAPPSNDSQTVEDIDSFMYQTIGHNIIPLYAEALGLPLYRQPIFGSAVNSSSTYSPPPDTSEDETESLVPLLRRVKAAHPNLGAVSTGAILSTYQRTRVESVALRLGLVPLAYLWQYTSLPPYDQVSLLRDMAAVGAEARIVKVGSGGLGSSMLWRDLSDNSTVVALAKAMGRFGDLQGGSLLGEGGEYETLALNGPSGLWKRRIIVEEQEVVEGEGGVLSLRLRGAQTADKMVLDEERLPLRIPDLSDDEFSRILDDLSKSTMSNKHFSLHGHNISERQPSRILLPTSVIISSTNFLLANITAPLSISTTPLEPTTQAESIFEQIKSILSVRPFSIHTSWPDHNVLPRIISTTLLLRSMDLFAPINKVYAAFFTSPNPPARVTLAIGDLLPPGIDIAMSVYGVKISNYITSTAKDVVHDPIQALHVQSRSYWAPANIGPYSQAVIEPHPSTLAPSTSMDLSQTRESTTKLVHLAGQIPLLPAHMTLHPSSTHQEFATAATLALQHLFRVSRAVQARWFAGAVALLGSPSEGDGNTERVSIQKRVDCCARIWRLAHLDTLWQQQRHEDGVEDDEHLDEAGDDTSLRQHWGPQHGGRSGTRRVDGAEAVYPTYRPAVPDWAVLRNQSDSIQLNRHVNGRLSTYSEIPPLFIAEVAQLPMSAPVEWTSMGITAPDHALLVDSPTIHDIPLPPPDHPTGTIATQDSKPSIKPVYTIRSDEVEVELYIFESAKAWGDFFLANARSSKGDDREDENAWIVEAWVSAAFSQRVENSHGLAATIVPCARVWAAVPVVGADVREDVERKQDSGLAEPYVDGGMSIREVAAVARARRWVKRNDALEGSC